MSKVFVELRELVFYNLMTSSATGGGRQTVGATTENRGPAILQSIIFAFRHIRGTHLSDPIARLHPSLEQ